LKEGKFEQLDVKPLIKENIHCITKDYTDFKIKDDEKVHFSFAPFSIGLLKFMLNISHYKVIHFKNKNSKTEKYYAQVKINIFTENCTVQFTEF
jgi:hypothetical protein